MISSYRHTHRNHYSVYLVGTTQYHRSTDGDDCRVVIASDSNALRFLAHFRNPLIRLCTSCKRRCLGLIACHLA